VKSLETLTPGVIHVAIESYMPYSGLTKGGTLTGLDGDILAAAAKQLGYKLSISVMDFAGTLAAVQSRRDDLTIGSVDWTQERTTTGLFTDPPYYSPSAAIEPDGENITSLGGFRNKTVGCLAGSTYLTAIPDIPGATLKAYTSVPEALIDLKAGRIAAYFTDPLIGVDAIKTTTGLRVDYITPPTEAAVTQNPGLAAFGKSQTAFYVAKQEPKLASALSRLIRQFYADGKEAAFVRQWGGNPKAFLTAIPLFSTQRRGVDRPTAWSAPSIHS
jgi:ABC-type amino acid transport substrate-binding protein